MSRSGSTPRRSVLTAALGVAGAVAVSTSAASAAGTARPAGEPVAAGGPKRRRAPAVAEYHGWSSDADWKAGTAKGVRVQSGSRPGIVISTPAGSTDYTDPHTGTKARWEYATWTSPVRKLSVPATEAIVSWNARTPAGTWIQIELKGTYSDATSTPWYVMGRWASGDGADSIRRTSVDDQSDDKSSVWTDTLSVDAPASGLRLVSYRIRLTLHRKPGTKLTPTVWRVGAMGSDVPDRFEVPASAPGLDGGRELTVPRYSQEIHKGQYPEYDNGGEAWCSPTSSQMIVEYWGRTPTAEDLAWVNPDYADPQVCHAARATFDYQYEGCGNWPFNAAYAATYRDLQGVVTRLGSLTDAEKLIGAGIPLITSQSFLKTELDGAGYGTAGHLMTVVGFTAEGDVIANDPASSSNEAVRHIYKRRQWENIWLRTKRYNADGKVVSGTGGVCYLYFPAKPTAAQRRVLEELGIR
ncbi:peptidase C39 family protein [Streptomyces cucumeris]|uniref:peptidase C39 family protein n=1 Tax=Streptomyces cucumeris TaxID=2962890 RepID=UPI0020C8D48B|nr:peptidase C39 family protein [Streptomyces sp. NEAU-Y11]MCP9207972.1 peptidase C39 family protein [Streptomyces sp. NEAU-Y11]